MIYSEDQKKIRDACARICVMVGQPPNAIAPEKYRSWVCKSFVKKEEPVRAWMLWIGTIEAAAKRKEWLKLKKKGQDKETLEMRAYIAKLIEETNPKPQKKHEYHTQKH